MTETATDPDGVVHVVLSDGTTACCRNALGWSRAITIAQLAGLVIYCEDCDAER